MVLATRISPVSFWGWNSMASDVGELLDRASRVMAYLGELSRRKSKPKTDIKKYNGLIEVYWSDLPINEPQVQFAAIGDDTDQWLRVSRPVFEDFPQPSENLWPWIKDVALMSDWEHLPELHDQILSDESTEEEDIFLSVGDFPQIQEEWSEYEDRWEAWAIERERKKPLEKTYKDLFKIAQQLEQSSEEYELLLGVCYLTWNHEGTQFRHPLVLE